MRTRIDLAGTAPQQDGGRLLPGVPRLAGAAGHELGPHGFVTRRLLEVRGGHGAAPQAAPAWGNGPAKGCAGGAVAPLPHSGGSDTLSPPAGRAGATATGASAAGGAGSITSKLASAP